MTIKEEGLDLARIPHWGGAGLGTVGPQTRASRVSTPLRRLP